MAQSLSTSPGETRQLLPIDADASHWVCFGKCQDTDHACGDVVDFARAYWSCDTSEAIKRLLDTDEIPVSDANAETACDFQRAAAPREPKWSARDFEAIERIVRDGPGLYDLLENSPLRFEDSETHAEEIIDIIFPGDPLLCVGKNNELFGTRRRSVWRGHLCNYPLIVPSPMISVWGRTTKGTMSEHSKEATADRVYLVIEFDFSIHKDDGRTETEFAPLVRSWKAADITVADACAALHWHLATLPAALPFVLAVHSGGKSLHGWFRAYPLFDEATWPFMRYAHQLGADHVTWCPSQFVRIPDGCQQNGELQKIYYLNPQEAVIDE